MVKNITFLFFFALPAFLSAQLINDYPTSGPIRIVDYSPQLILQRNTNEGGFIQGVQTKFIDGTNNWFFGNINGSNWFVSKGGHEDVKFSISDNGNVGVGIANPAALLHVAGNSIISGSIRGESPSSGYITQSAVYPYTTSIVSSSDATNILLSAGSTGGFVSSISVNGRNNGNGIQFSTRSTEVMRISDNGNVGIGTTNPAGKLHVGPEISNMGDQTVRIATHLGTNGSITDALHIDACPSTTYDQGVSISMGLKNSIYGEYTSRIVHYGYANATRESKLQLQTHSSLPGVWNTGILIDNIGNVGIGNINPGNYRLNVSGKIRADEIVVNTTGADFVFQPEYELPDLIEIEKFIKENKHLPDIEPASDMIENGMNVSEMQTKLLQKIEELTLYVIELKKEIDTLKLK